MERRVGQSPQSHPSRTVCPGQTEDTPGRLRSWNDLLADPRFHWKEPDAGVVASAGRWLAEGRRVVYDLGCGAGRHMAYLGLQGFEVFGTDVSENGLAACGGYLREAGLPARLARADMTASPFRSGVFDAGIATNVLNHNPRALLQRAADDILRVLRPGGEFYLTVLNTWDWRYGNGEEVEPDTFMLADGPEAGIQHHFFSEGDLRRWLSAFAIVTVRRERGELTLSTKPGDRPVVRDAWAVWVRKP
jgi:SAM-dependent methyltransferase